MWVRECNAGHPFLLPIRPVAKLFCDAYQLTPHSKLWASALFLLNCGLLLGSYVLTHDISNFTQDILYRLIGEQLPKQAVMLAAGWLAQLVITNSAFFLVRFVLAKFMYVIYELGRDVVFSILILTIITGSTWLCLMYYSGGVGATIFVQTHRLFVIGLIVIWTIVSWYWARYIYGGRGRKHVFDHEVGAALIQLSS